MKLLCTSPSRQCIYIDIILFCKTYYVSCFNERANSTTASLFWIILVLLNDDIKNYMKKSIQAASDYLLPSAALSNRCLRLKHNYQRDTMYSRSGMKKIDWKKWLWMLTFHHIAVSTIIKAQFCHIISNYSAEKKRHTGWYTFQEKICTSSICHVTNYVYTRMNHIKILRQSLNELRPVMHHPPTTNNKKRRLNACTNVCEHWELVHGKKKWSYRKMFTNNYIYSSFFLWQFPQKLSTYYIKT